jgi:hypothetical protein
LPELPFTVVIPVAVTEEVATGFVVDQVTLAEQLLFPAVIVQSAELIPPDMTVVVAQVDPFHEVPPAQLADAVSTSRL